MISQVAKLFSLVENCISPSVCESASRIFFYRNAVIKEWSPSEGTVSQVLPSLKARLEISVKNGIQVYGLAETIVQFERLPSELKVVCYVVDSEIGIAIVYLHWDEQKGIGVILPPRIDLR